MGINIFEDFLSNNSSPIKIDKLYEFQQSYGQLLYKFNKLIKDFKDLDPKKAAYYAQLAIKPNPIKIRKNKNEDFDIEKDNDKLLKVLDPVSGWKTYFKVLNEIANYKQNIEDIKELPFKGRDTIENYTLDDSSLWDIKLQKYEMTSDKIPENPLKLIHKDSTPWFPTTRVSLKYSTIKNQTFLLPNNLKLIIPQYKYEVPNIEITCFDNQESIIRRYFTDYMNAIYDSKKRTLPYKEASSELTLYIYTQDKKIKFKKIFYVIPNYEFGIEADSAPRVTEFRINFNVIGESNDLLNYKHVNPYIPRK